MAKVTTTSTTVYCLRLTEEEAEFLKGALQNPVCALPTPKQEEHRESIWRGLDAAGVASV
jgi:hypothetical protein